ncbi:MAG: coiled-coil domain-containing protein [Planctomycetota bacterium]
MPDQEKLPDIDAGLAELSQETTAADLLRQKGQTKKLKVINKEQLKAQIQEWIRQALNSVVAANAASLEDHEREAFIQQTEVKVQELMRRNRQAEADRAKEAEERNRLEERLDSLASDHGANEELRNTIRDLQDRLQRAETSAQDAQADLVVVEEDLDNTKKVFRTTLEEKERLNTTVREHMMHASDLVGRVLELDAAYYGNRHSVENPLTDDDAAPGAAFYHDFVVGAAVVGTLSDDLARLRQITSAAASSGSSAKHVAVSVPADNALTLDLDDEVAAESAPTAAEGEQLLERDLELISQLRSGSLEAVDVAAPVENLAEALSGVRSEVVALHQVLAPGVPFNVSPLPDDIHDDDNPAEVIAEITHVSRELATCLAQERGRLGNVASDGADKANAALRQHMIRTTDLVQGVLALDGEFYGASHQEDNPLPDDAEGEEFFYHDFDVGAKVIDSLSQDLGRLREITAAGAAAGGGSASVEAAAAADGHKLLASDLALIEQLKAGSLEAVDVAAPVENLIEALHGAADEVSELKRTASEAIGLPDTGPSVSTLPESDGDPAEVLAGATQVVRELSAALAAERRRVAAVQTLLAAAEERGPDDEAEAAEVPASSASVTPVFDTALITAVADAAKIVGVEPLPALADAEADPAERSVAAEQALAAMAEQVQAASLADDHLNEGLADLAQSMGLTDDNQALAPASEADMVARLAAAREMIDSLRRRLDEELNSLSDLDNIASVASADIPVSIAADLAPEESIDVEIKPGDTSAHQRRELVARLRYSVQRLSMAYNEAQARLTGERARSRALADRLTVLAQHITPQAAADEPVAAAIARVSEAGVASDAAQGGEDAALASAAEDEFGDAMIALAQVIDERAEAAPVSAPAPAVVDLVASLNARLKEDEVLSASDPVADLDLVLDVDDGEEVDVAAAVAAGAQAVGALDERRRLLVERVADLESQLADAQAGSASAQEAAAAEQGRIASQQEELEAMTATVEEQAQALSGAQERVAELEAELATVRSSGEEAAAAVAVEQQRLIELEAALAAASEQADTHATSLAVAEGRITELEAELEVVRSGGEEVAAAAAVEQQRLIELEAALAAASEQADTHATSLAMAEGRGAELEAELEVVRSSGQEAAAAAAVEQQRLIELEAALATATEQGDKRAESLAASEVRIAELEGELAAARTNGEEALSSATAEAQRTAELAAELAKLKGQIAERAEAQAAVEVRAAELNAELGVAKAAGSAAESAAAAEHQRLLEVEAELTTTQEAVVQTEAMVADLSQRLAVVTAAESQLHSSLSNCVDEVLPPVGEDQQLDELREELIASRAELEGDDSGTTGAASQVLALSVAERVVGELRRRITDLDARLVAESSERSTLSETLATTEEAASAAMVDAEAAKATVAETQAALAASGEELQAAKEQIDTLQIELDELTASSEREHAVMRDARAALEEYRAREGEANSRHETTLARLRDDLAGAQSARTQLELEVGEVKEDLESVIAGLQARLSDQEGRLGERDERIGALREQLDAELNRRVDGHELEVRLQTLLSELESERALRQSMETRLVEHKQSVADELTDLVERRDELVERGRQLEEQLNEERGRSEGLRAAKDNLRKDMGEQIERIKAGLEQERIARDEAEAALGQLREEIAGLRARVRSLTDDGSGAADS